jgi:signal recognition particle receptor subunit beta
MSELRETLVGKANRLSEIATELGLPSLSEEIVHDTERRLDESKIRALVIGEIKQGKSTLINAILRQDTLPTGVTPTTGAVVLVRAGEDTGAYLDKGEGEREKLDETRFKRLAKGPAKGKSMPAVDQGDIECIVEPGVLPDALELVDTPGINDISAFRTALSRGELPRADILVLVLDATQLLNRTEMAFLRDAIAAVGGLQDSGARLLIAVNRIDLIAERERPKLREYLQTELETLWNEHGSKDAGYDLFFTDARTALRDPAASAPGVEGVGQLRASLEALTRSRASVLPLRAKASLLRYGSLLGHNASVAAHALGLELETLRREIRAAERELSGAETDLTRLRAMMSDEREKIIKQSTDRIEEFRSELTESVLASIDAASQRTLSSHLAGSIHDAYVVFAHRESERLRASLDAVTRKVIHAHSEQARRRLFHATMRLSYRGPTVYINPPSLLLEAGMVVIGVAGTAVMYFGNVVAGMLMAIAGPLTTVVLREKSLREARASAKQELPGAMERASAALREQIRRTIDAHLSSLDEHLVLANVALGEQLMGVLHTAEKQLEAAASEEDGQLNRQRALFHLERELQDLRRQLENVGADVIEVAANDDPSSAA